MKKTFFTLLLGACMLPLLHAQWSIVELDSMKDGETLFIDNTLRHPEHPFDGLQIWEKTDPDGVTTFQALSQSDSIHNNVGASEFWNSYDLIFPEPIDRIGGDTIKVEWDMLFDLAAGSGEGGRSTIVLMKDLPGGGIPDDNPANWGTPAYYVWIFNGSYGQSLSYGGSYETSPGWLGGAGGIYYNQDFDGDAAGPIDSKENWPLVPYTKYFDQSYFSPTTWKHYTWVLSKELQELYWRDSKDGPEADVRINFMALPENETDVAYINEVHGTVATEMPPAYEWFEEVNALRVWSRSATRNEGNNYFYLSNVMVSKTGTPMGSYAEFQKSQDRPREDIGNYNLVLIGTNMVEGVTTMVTVEPVDGNMAHIANWPGDTIEFDSDGAQATRVPIVNTTLEVFDTITMKITDISGGRYPAVGEKNEFKLIIRPADGETGIASSYEVSKLDLSPNPAMDFIRIESSPRLQDATLQVFDMSGKLVIKRKYLQERNIDISALDQGMYFMQLEGSGGVYMGKFIKQ